LTAIWKEPYNKNMHQVIEAAKKPFLTALFIFVFLYVFAKLFGPIPFAVNSITTSSDDLFSVTGTGEVSGTAKTTNFSVGVTETAATADAARSAMNTATNKVIERLKALGIDEKKIKTTNYNINPNYDYSRGGQGTITGYTASQSLEVEAESTDIAQQAIDASTQAGANVISGVQFELTETNRKELEMEATKKAIADAKEKAQEIAGLSGIKLGRVMNIQVNPAGGQPPIMFQAKEAFGGVADSATRLAPGENKVMVSVTLFYETL
jgi:uncharacterized protein